MDGVDGEELYAGFEGFTDEGLESEVLGLRVAGSGETSLDDKVRV